MEYPSWQYYPTSASPPSWVSQFVAVVAASKDSISSKNVESLNSDRVLSHLAGGLAALGYQVEVGKSAAQKIRRPVLFGENGQERVAYEVDAFHDELGIVVEVEAGVALGVMRHTEISSAHL